MNSKQLLLILTFVCGAFFNQSYAQSSFDLYDESHQSMYVPYYCDTFEVKYYHTVENVGNGVVYAKASREKIVFQATHQNWFCWDIKCYPPFTDVAADNETIAMQPGDTTKSFKGMIKANNDPGIDIIKYCFFDTLSPTDSTCVNVTYECTQNNPNSINENALPGVTISSVFPNPANDRINLGYDLKDQNQRVTATIFDMQGRNLGEHQLSGWNGVKTFDLSNLNTGLYMMLVTVDGIPAAQRQFTVAR